MLKLISPIALFAIITFQSNAFACADIDEILKNPNFTPLTDTQKAEIRKSSIPSEDKRLLAYCYEKSCFISKVCETPLKTIDISRVVTGNLGKIGWKPQYDRIENRPLIVSSNWQDSFVKLFSLRGLNYANPTHLDDPDKISTLIRTRIWRDGQHYTVYEALMLSDDMPLYR